MSTPSVAVPDQSRVGEPFPVTLSGFSPSTAVALELSATDGYGRICHRTERVETDPEGRADLEDFGGALLWTLSPSAGSDPAFFVAGDTPSVEDETCFRSFPHHPKSV